MKPLSRFAAAAAAATFGLSTAQLLKFNPPGQSALTYTFAAAHPNVTGSASDIFMQIQGPASMSWIALGQGEAMKDSQMFIIYANSAGTNVTVSPRLSGGHDEPSAENGPDVSLLAGSGIANGNMTANILCRNCNSWQGGAMNLSGSGQSWIWAFKSGSPIKSDSISAHIEQHDDGSYSAFVLNLNILTAGNTSNPFLEVANISVINAGDSSARYDGNGVPIHGVIMCLAFVIGFPLGAFLIRLASFRGLLWIHAGIQILSFLAAILGLGVGIYIANKGAARLSAFHPILGIAIVVLLVFQPILGYVHHLQYKRYQTQTAYTHAHVWFGRVIVTAGLIDGVLGLALADQSTGLIVLYCIVAGGVWFLWIVIIVCAAKRQERTRVQRNNIRMATLVDEWDENDRRWKYNRV